MKNHVFCTSLLWVLCAFIFSISASLLTAAKPPSGVSQPIFDFNDSNQRQAFVDTLRQRRQSGIERAAKYLRQSGKPKRWQNGQSICELMSIEEDGQFIVYTTCNANSAISIAADITRDDPYYGFTGNGVTVGVWDAGRARPNHQELTGRTIWKDAVSPVDNYHSTAVSGTIAATGIDPLAKGMAPLTQIWGYEWNNDTDEMATVARSSSEQTNTIQISNHSYGTVCGWYSPSTNVWHWYGNSSYDESTLFGQYSAVAQVFDEVCYNAPYYLAIRAAGNDRSDGRPAAGSTYYINGSTVATFNGSTPYADNYDNGGFDTLMPDGCAKNVLTVGGVNDAVTGGRRDLIKATMNYRSSWGPTDDGRIKPDVVANCQEVYSCSSGSDTAYTTLTGTSLAAPAAAGVAAQLVELYSLLFPGQFMRSSTIKGLIIHTADDLGNLGPDYKFGWGLINTEAAVEKILLYKRNPNAPNIIEESLKNSSVSGQDNFYDDFYFVWDGTSPIKATLCYTDPAGIAASLLDDRTQKIVNDLDITITAPDGIIIYNEFVLDWLNPNNPATTGNNDRDNVKQVIIDVPTQQGTYAIRVYDYGLKRNTIQSYSLIISGQVQPSVYDIDRDGTIGLGDFVAIANAWLTNTAASDIYPAIGDGIIDLFDFNLLSQAWDEP